MRSISENMTYTKINLITSSGVHGVFVLLKKEGKDMDRWRRGWKVGWRLET